MIYSIDAIIHMVRLAMSLDCHDKPLIRCRDPDIVPLDRLIISRIGPVVRQVYTEAPISLLLRSAKDLDSDDVCWHRPVDDLYSGHLSLPHDFLRLVVFQMDDWQRPVIEALTPESPYFEAASTRYSGARGTPFRPACLISNTALGATLEFHSCFSDTASIAQAKYIPIPHIDIDGGIDIDPNCLDLVISYLVKSEE